ncbi:MAG: lysophospholipid acyltransferase family protein [Planctomycetota bacterium]|nr:lysophospholipid acyltransferase family protein [Planctomycetota bacterium]
MRILSWVRGLCLWTFWLVWTALAWLVITLTWPFAPHGHFAGWWGRIWARGILLSSGVRLTVDGRHNVRGGPFVVLGNHSSMLDIAVCYAALPIQLRFVSRPFFFKVPFLGWGMWLARHVSMDPKRPREAAAVLRSLDRRFRRGVSIVMFPEGTRSRDGQVQRYKRGPILLGVRSDVTLLPICICGTFEALPKGRFLPKPGRVRVVIGEPVPTSGVDPGDARRLASEIEAWTRAAKSEPAS